MIRKKSERILRILSLLKKLTDGGKINTVKEGEIFNVCNNSIRRDMNTIEESGWPIVCERDFRDKKFYWKLYKGAI